MINLTKYKKYVLIKTEGETLMENKRFENRGATLLASAAAGPV